MPFAELPFVVPAYFPDLQVTSYKRASGSHGNYKAVDLALLSNLSRERGSLYWFYYFSIIEILWRWQRRGILRVAEAPNCPHYHLELSTDENLAGVEIIAAVKLPNGKYDCQYVSHFNVKNTSGVEKWAWIDTFREHYVAPWVPGTAATVFESIKNAPSAGKYKKIKVFTNNYIGVEDLQNKINAMFGTGSVTGLFADTVSQWVGYENLDDLKTKLPDKLSLLWFGLFLGGAYYVAREMRYWENPKE